ncbi:MAG: glycosyltransferase family 2 protein [Nocardioides alkalitolerans]
MSRPARAGRAAVAAGSAVALGCLALTVDNLRRLRTPALPAGAPTGSRPTEPVTVVLPVRDEEGDLRACATSVLAALDAWPGRGRLVVVDDRSTDRTLAVAAELAEQDPRVVVRAGAPTPRGWLGKPWACHQGAQAVDTEGVLVFVDADVRLAAHALVASVDLLRSSGLDLVSPYPRQRAHGVAERLVQPLLQWSWMSTLPLGLAERSSRPSLSAANGQLLVVDAMAYHDAGGHAAVRTAVLEDIALLRALKAVGRHGGVVDGSDLATCRMYAGWPALRAGYRKSLWSAFGSPVGALGVLAMLLLAYVVPPLAALRGSRTGLLGYAAGVASRVLVARRTRGRALPDALAHPASVLVLTGLTLDSLVARRRGELRWRGRPVEVER